MARWLTILFCAVACHPTATPEEISVFYLEDAEFRREVLQDSLWRPELPYSRNLLGNYALPEGGWDLLPELDTDLLDEPTPTTATEWLKLGERVFYELPMRSDAYLTWAVDNPDVWNQLGIEADSEGHVVGLVDVGAPNGANAKGMSCAFCHSAKGEAGRANRNINLGLARALHRQAFGQNGDIYKTWGAGRIDVTDDGVNGPTAIPDLWGVKYAQYLNHSGVIKVTSQATLAARFESQYILGHKMQYRPNRTLMWALAQFVLSLEPPENTNTSSPQSEHAFQKHCSSCHNPEQGYAGGLVPAASLTSNSTVATTPERGTGFYKVPSLVGVREAAPYLHDGSQHSLQALLASGHPYGAVLPLETRTQILNFLNTL